MAAIAGRDDPTDRQRALRGENAAGDQCSLAEKREPERLEQQEPEQREKRLLRVLVDVGRDRRGQRRRMH